MWQRIVLPANLLGAIHLKSFRDRPLRKILVKIVRDVIMEQADTPRSFAVCIGLGVSFGILPIWGFQMVVAGFVAHQLRLSKPLTLAASNISFPAAIPLILYLSLLLGTFALTGRIRSFASIWTVDWQTVWACTVEYLVGSVILAITAGSIAMGISYILARRYSLWRKKV
jgi:uncharacterized protein (DUF2062 family)